MQDLRVGRERGRRTPSMKEKDDDLQAREEKPVHRT